MRRIKVKRTFRERLDGDKKVFVNLNFKGLKIVWLQKDEKQGGNSSV